MAHYPRSAPLALRLPEEVYSLDSDYMVAPGARLEVGPHGKLYESMGDLDDEVELALQNLKGTSTEELQSLLTRGEVALAKKPPEHRQTGIKILNRIRQELMRRGGIEGSFAKYKTPIMIGGAVVGALVLWKLLK